METAKAGRVGGPPSAPPPSSGGGGSGGYKSASDLIESAYQRGHVRPEEVGLLDRLKQQSLRYLKETFIPSWEIKGSDKVTTDGKTRSRFFATATDFLRTLHSYPRNAREQAQSLTRSIWKNLAPDEYDIAKRYIYLRDAYENLVRGMERRPGFDQQSVTEELGRLQGIVDKNPDIRIALKNYKDLMNSVRDVALAEGLLHKTDRDWYMPHQVIDYRSITPNKEILGITIPKLTSGGVRWKQPANLRQRGGSARDISTNLADLMENYLSDVFTQMEKRKALNSLGHMYDVRNNPTYVDKQGNKVEFVEHGGQIPPGFVEWAPDAGFSRVRASSLAERFLGEMIDYGTLDDLAVKLGINPVDFREAIINDAFITTPKELVQKLGASQLPPGAPGDIQRYVIPEELARTLNKAVTTMNSAESMGASEKLVRTWKSIVLNMAPVRYNFRNFVGDFQRMYTQFGNEVIDPKRWARVTRSVADYYNKGTIDPLMQQMLDHGISSSGRIQSEYSISRVDPHLRKLEKMEVSDLKKAGESVWRLLSILPEKSSMREDIVRGVLVDMNLTKLAEGKTPLMGVSDPEIVKGLLDAGEQRRAVSYIARKALLDYGDFTPRENQWRNTWFPFYAWASGNFSFWNRIGKELATSGLKGRGGDMLARGSSQALVKGAAGMALVYATVHAWNDKVMGDYEENLPENIKKSLHVIVPDYEHWKATGEFRPSFDEEGRARVWNTPDALDDFLTYVGLDTAMPEMMSLMRGTISKDELIRRQRDYFGWGGGLIPKGPVRTVLKNLGPREQVVSQMVGGKRFFPDPLNPTDIAPDQRLSALRDVLGLGALPGIENAFGAASPNTEIFQPTTKLYDIPKQLGFSSAREPSIFLDGQLLDPTKAGTTRYEADLIRKIGQTQYELRDLQGRLRREISGQSNRQLDEDTRAQNLHLRVTEIQHLADQLKELGERYRNLRRSRRVDGLPR